MKTRTWPSLWVCSWEQFSPLALSADFILVTLCGLAGAAVGLYMEGQIDVRNILDWRKK